MTRESNFCLDSGAAKAFVPVGTQAMLSNLFSEFWARFSVINDLVDPESRSTSILCLQPNIGSNTQTRAVSSLVIFFKAGRGGGFDFV